MTNKFPMISSASTDRNFRPVNPQIGPDGALYFGDWCNALIGHMQYSQRDPNRDHTRGRIYRMTYKGKPLLKPITQFGKSEAELLDQLKEYELRVRYRARRELFDRPDAKVVAAVKTWVAKLDPNDKDYERLLVEALWAQQSHHRVDIDLLKRVLAREAWGSARRRHARAGGRMGPHSKRDGTHQTAGDGRISPHAGWRRCARSVLCIPRNRLKPRFWPPDCRWIIGWNTPWI